MAFQLQYLGDARPLGQLEVRTLCVGHGEHPGEGEVLVVEAEQLRDLAARQQHGPGEAEVDGQATPALLGPTVPAPSR
jgi:hypothetical protein